MKCGEYRGQGQAAQPIAVAPAPTLGWMSLYDPEETVSFLRPTSAVQRVRTVGRVFWRTAPGQEHAFTALQARKVRRQLTESISRSSRWDMQVFPCETQAAVGSEQQYTLRLHSSVYFHNIRK
jgi:hypothetical protein